MKVAAAMGSPWLLVHLCQDLVPFASPLWFVPELLSLSPINWVALNDRNLFSHRSGG